ncbi:hypothetical protein HPB52_023313 [Rhipicephalus sanguineus]|uniref:Presenilin n=1 Tax=Rhipicephalus sanguineus TaxID=34632 RepID=A0A9D4PRS6_RHISA|nr:hypothetical protein HPB52_023313 [Rhipicephalus sanguineus]
MNRSLADKALLLPNLVSDPLARSGEMTSERAGRVSQTASSIRSGLELAADDSQSTSACRENEDSTVSFEGKLRRFSEPNEAMDPPCSSDKVQECRNEFNARTATESMDGKGSTPTRSAANTAVPDDRGVLQVVQPDNYNDAGGAVERQSLQHAALPALPPTPGSHRCPRHGRAHHRRRVNRSQAERELGDEMSGDRGMKMGLGDFIFYSVLVGKASRHGTALTVIACYVAIIVGILLTLSLLVYLQKPLPALPFSIGLGIAAYFSSSFLAEPFIGDVAAIIY